MIKPLLIEIGVEELPAIPFLKELPQIEKLWMSILEQNALACAFEFYYTPRRMVLWHKEFPLTQESREEEFFGAPLSVALKEGAPTAAALGFAKKCGVDFSAITHTLKDGKEVLYFKQKIEGKESRELLKGMIESFLKGLNFGKAMRWGFLEESFIRPIRWFGCMLGEEHVPFTLFGVDSTTSSYPHRTLSYAPFSYTSGKAYFERMEQSGVVLYPALRQEIILSDFEGIEQKEGVLIERDVELLAEVVTITEYPKALIGSFEERFLRLPPEVIITSMKENQRYFPVFKNGVLTNRFVVVSNAISDDYDLIVKGNEKVLRARLSDAIFFLDNDLKKGLSYEGLKTITYLDGLGSLFDKEVREYTIARFLTQKYTQRLLANQTQLTEHSLQALMERSIMLSKSDLMSEMVYEFTELQGLMGEYYARAANEDALLCLALKEQYLPNSEESALPSSDFSAIVALAHKLDSLIALFSIGKVPTGTKDPYALRRAVNGIIKIVLERRFAFNIKEDLDLLSTNYQAFDKEGLENFILERLYQFFDVNPSVIKAVISSGERDLVKLSLKIKALASVVMDERFKSMSSTFKRVANIIKNNSAETDLSVNESLFEGTHEQALYDAYKSIIVKDYSSYEETLDALFGLKPHIDAFFDNVMVNTENMDVRTNRQNIIALIYTAFKTIADIKEISI